MQLPLITVDKAILEALKVPPPEHHLDHLTGEDIAELLPLSQHQRPSGNARLVKIAVTTHEFHRSLKKLIDGETDKNMASIVELFNESRRRLLHPILGVLRKKYQDFIQVLPTKKVKVREAHLRSQLIHSPEKLSTEEYTEAITALQKAISTPMKHRFSKRKAYKASLERVLAREEQSSRLNPVTLEPLTPDPQNIRKRGNTIPTDEEETPSVRKRSKTVAMSPEEELERELFGSPDCGEDEDDHESIEQS